MSEEQLREAVKRFCRTEEAVDNLVKFILNYGREQAEKQIDWVMSDLSDVTHYGFTDKQLESIMFVLENRKATLTQEEQSHE